MYASQNATFLPALVLLAALGLAAAPGRAQTLYVSASGGGIQTFNTTTGAATPFSPTFVSGNVNHATGTAFDSVGNLIVVNAFGGVGNAGTLEKITPGGIGTQINTFLSSGDLNDPYGLALDGAGNIYLGNKGDSLIEKITPAGVGTIFAGPAQGVSLPRGLAFDSAGNLYVANTGNNTIEKFNTVTGVSTLFAGSAQGLNGPIGLAFDRIGNLYVANFSGDNITEFNTVTGASTLFSKSFTSGSIRSPYGLAIDDAGNLYTANASPGTIERFDTSGNGTLFASGLTSPNYLTFKPGLGTPTPEPSTWAAFGFTGVFVAGLMLRARHGRRRSIFQSRGIRILLCAAFPAALLLIGMAMPLLADGTGSAIPPVQSVGNPAAALDAAIRQNTDVNAVYEDQTLLMWAAQLGDLPAVRLLLDRGAKITASTPGTENVPLTLAVAYQHPEIVSLLLSRGADTGPHSPPNAMPLLRAAAGNTALVKSLLKSGVSPNLRGVSTGITPLMWAVTDCVEFQRDDGSVRTLIALGADVNARLSDDSMPLSFALRFHLDAIAALLRKAGAKEPPSDAPIGPG